MRRIILAPHSVFCLSGVLLMLFWLGLESQAWARAGGGKSSGSRSYGSGGSNQRAPSQSPSSTPGQKNYQQPSQPQPASPVGPSRTVSFLSGLGGRLLGGRFAGMLFLGLGGAGDQNLGGGGFGFGDLFLILILLGIIYFIFKRFRSRQTLQMSAAGAGATSYSFPGSAPGPIYTPPAPPEFQEGKNIAGLRHIQEMDRSFNEKTFIAFAKDLFFKVQTHFAKRNIEGLRPLLTPAMFDGFATQLNELTAQRHINRLENVSVREAEIIDAGQDHGEEFITVKISATLLDYVVEEGSDRIISGSDQDPVLFAEHWTLARNVGEKNWILAGIHQEKDWQ